jgi:hypothetical protein
MQVTLEAAEAEILRDVLAQYLTDLRGEIGKTDDRGVRRELHERERVLQKVLGQLRS